MNSNQKKQVLAWRIFRHECQFSILRSRNQRWRAACTMERARPVDNGSAMVRPMRLGQIIMIRSIGLIGTGNDNIFEVGLSHSWSKIDHSIESTIWSACKATLKMCFWRKCKARSCLWDCNLAIIRKPPAKRGMAGCRNTNEVRCHEHSSTRSDVG